MARPIFVATHPRACSTAFERVFMTRRDTISCVHEPFGDAWYFGLERLSSRFEGDEEAREKSGFAQTTYGDIFNAIDKQAKEGKRLFIKDMAQYWMAPPGSTTTGIAPSLVSYRRGVGTNGEFSSSADSSSVSSDAGSVHNEPGNPTVLPDALLRKYHFTFLIRHPRSSVPSYYRCTIPPLNKMTGFEYFDPHEAGYKELRILFDYLVENGHIGPKRAGVQTNGHDGTNGTNGTNGNLGASGTAVANEDDAMVDICVVDADDMLDNPYGIIEAYCKSVGVKYDPGMLKWEDEATQVHAKECFEKWKGFHEDAIDSKELTPRTVKKAPKSDGELMSEWTQKFGEDAAKVMMNTVEENVADYEYLRKFALKV